MKVNEITEKEAKEYLGGAFEVYFNRSLHQWTLDISYLDDILKEYNEKPWYDKL
jgi:hypothetical protein